MTSAEKESIGLGRDVVRLSIGIEGPNDIVQDIANAFQKVCNLAPGNHVQRQQREKLLFRPVDRSSRGKAQHHRPFSL